MKDPITTSDCHMVKLIQMPTLRFVVFFFWQNLLAENSILAELCAMRPEDVT